VKAKARCDFGRHTVPRLRSDTLQNLAYRDKTLSVYTKAMFSESAACRDCVGTVKAWGEQEWKAVGRDYHNLLLDLRRGNPCDRASALDHCDNLGKRDEKWTGASGIAGVVVVVVRRAKGWAWVWVWVGGVKEGWRWMR